MPIWKQHLLSRLHRPEGGGEGGGSGGGGSGPTITPEVQAIIDAAIAKEVQGLKTKNAELLESNRTLKDAVKKFDGIDPDQVRTILSRFADDEEGKLIAAGKIDEVLTKRTERMQAEHTRLLNEALGKAEAAGKRLKAYEGRVLDDAVRAAAAKAGLHQHAIDDALFRARSMFALDDTGQAVQFDESGKPVLGKDGKTPFTPAEWLDGMKEKAPHWFPASASGGGAGGGGGGSGGGGKTPENLTQAKTKEERIAVFKARLKAAGSGD